MGIINKSPLPSVAFIMQQPFKAYKYSLRQTLYEFDNSCDSLFALGEPKVKGQINELPEFTHQGALSPSEKVFNLRVYFKQLMWIHAMALMSSLGLYLYFI